VADDMTSVVHHRFPLLFLSGFQSVLKLVDNTCKDSFDLFYGLFKYNKHSADQILKLREAFANVERQLAAKEAYLLARAEVRKGEIAPDQWVSGPHACGDVVLGDAR